MKDKILQLFDKGLKLRKKKKISQIFFSGLIKNSRALSVYNGETDSLEIADEVKMGVWVEEKDAWGCASFERTNEKSLLNAIEAAQAAARYNEPDPCITLAPASSGGVEKVDPSISSVSIAELRKFALELESGAKQFSSRVTNIPMAATGYEVVTRILRNSKDLSIVEKNAFFHTSLSVMAMGKDQRTVNAHESNGFLKLQDYRAGDMIVEVAGEAVSRMEPRSVPSGEYPILFDPRMSVQILGTFAAIFSGDFLYKGLTRLAGKVGQKISSDVVSIIDEGLAGLVPHQFDAEGMKCVKKTIVDRGVLKSFLQNRYTAKKTGFRSTGNAAGGLEALPGVSPANIAWGGKVSFAQSLLSGLHRGLLIKELHGASASPISGDFSYGALGYWVENGKIQYPVADFTVAGNIFDLLMKIEGVGNDLRYFSPHMLGSSGGRSLLVSSLTVSGK